MVSATASAGWNSKSSTGLGSGVWRRPCRRSDRGSFDVPSLRLVGIDLGGDRLEHRLCRLDRSFVRRALRRELDHVSVVLSHIGALHRNRGLATEADLALVERQALLTRARILGNRNVRGDRRLVRDLLDGLGRRAVGLGRVGDIRRIELEPAAEGSPIATGSSINAGS